MNPYFDLGSYSRPISTSSPDAQLWFDRGLLWTYGFNHEEAIVCFQKAVSFDPQCAMAYWGLAYASGPFYNKPWEFYGEDERIEALAFCFTAVSQAVANLEQTTPTEKALITTLAIRYPAAEADGMETFTQWECDYADQMSHVYAAFPDDLDVVSLYAEAMMNKTPWQLWDIHQAQPADGADTARILAVLEAGLERSKAQNQPHTGIYHLYIHAQEMSPHPEKALKTADFLRDLCPDGGHLQHMPSHIDLLCGHYQNAIVANHKAIAADKKYLGYLNAHNFYTSTCCHNFHLLMYAAMLSGQYEAALAGGNGITELLTETVLRVDIPHLASTLEAYYSMKMHVLVRFGKWEEIIAAPLPSDPQLYMVTTTMAHYARGIAFSVTGQIDKATIALAEFQAHAAQIPTSRRFFNNAAQDVLAVGEKLLMGELAYRQQKYEEAFVLLRESVYLDDNLAYTEPWAWMHPPRHALGALLLEQNQIEEATAVYRADLGYDNTVSRPLQHPNNVWSLRGYADCLKAQQKTAELNIIEPQLTLALARTDVPIHASCFCKLDHHCCE